MGLTCSSVMGAKPDEVFTATRPVPVSLSPRGGTASHHGAVNVALLLFTRDLRVRDNPALAGACARARAVLPLFVVDPALAVPPNRARRGQLGYPSPVTGNPA